MASLILISVQISCSQCGKIIRYCQSCWRNHRYCSGACAKLSRLTKQRVHQSKYRKTEKGILVQMKANRRYRLKQNKNIVSEQTTQQHKQLGISTIMKSHKCYDGSGFITKVIVLNLETTQHFSIRRFAKNMKGYDSG